jgi:Cu-Zn family superoxide dismutase
MKHSKKAAALLAALVVSVALAACGSESESSDVVSGQLEPVPGVSADYQEVAGEASLERADGKTTVSLKATGLEPKTGYEAHLHTQGCDQSDPGGPHFKFDPAGGDEPPNEIHLEFSTNAAGAGDATAASKREVPVGEAGSVVLHEAGEDHMTAGAATSAQTVFVHEGHDHGEGGGGTGSGAPSAPLKLACATLEGGGEAGAGAATVVVRNGEPVDGVQELEFSAGERIRFNVKSDVADEIHVHGYDLAQDVAAGGEVSFDFPADIEGIFEVELEGRKEQIAELRVNP